ncbi:hypothetical protein [Curtobacterium sp. Leaf261]|uniref:hypothetical protein n=1 Tax=Curtobacterium sp. Leaf261 TaxID=1736311 RepID=UPI0012E20D66|nr:hypothetical protein [Curtobacterium sp. Leaf261]
MRVVMLAFALACTVLLAGCTARDPVEPGPVSSSQAPSATASAAEPRIAPSSGPGPLGSDAWYRTALPVEGSIIGMVRASGANGSPSPASGTVRITRDGDRAVRITVTGLTVTTQPDSDLRVQLAASDIVTGADGVGSVVRSGSASGVAGGDPIEVGLLPNDASTVVLTFRTPQILPASVHSLVILDYTHATVIAGAELAPTDD